MGEGRNIFLECMGVLFLTVIVMWLMFCGFIGIEAMDEETYCQKVIGKNKE